MAVAFAVHSSKKLDLTIYMALSHIFHPPLLLSLEDPKEKGLAFKKIAAPHLAR